MTDSPDADSLPRLLRDHARRYPAWTDVDLYKLLHQGEFGSEHAVADRQTAAVRLEQELAQPGPGPAEPLLDPIRADGALVRVHLRPWLELRVDPSILLEAFLQTARRWRGSPLILEASLEAAARLADQIGLAREGVTTRAAEMKAAGFPAVHHSSAYETAYRPAYRVIAVRFLPRSLLDTAWRS